MNRLLMLTLVFAFSAIVLGAQDPTPAKAGSDDVKSAVKNLVDKATALRKLGRGARIHVRTHAKTIAPNAGMIVDELRSQLRKTEPRDDVDQETYDKQCIEFCQAAKVVMDAGVDASATLETLATAEADADAKSLIHSADRGLYVNLMKTETAKFQGKGTFAGMYAGLIKYAPKIGRVALTVLGDKDLQLQERYDASLIISETTKAKDAEVLAELEKLYQAEDQKSQQSVHGFISNTMARLGDTTHFDEMIRPMKERLEAEAQKPSPNFNVYVGSALSLARAYEGICAYDQTLKFYLIGLVNVVQQPIDKLPANMRTDFAGHLYNMACAASRLGETGLGLWAVDQSFNYGGTNFDWAMEDGDLANLRKSEEFAKMIKEWKAKERKPLQQPELESFMKMAQKFLPKPPASDKSSAESRPTSQPASGS